MGSEILKNIYLFKDFSSPEIDLINKLTKESVFTRGQRIFSQGDVATCFYIIKKGSVRIVQSSSKDTAVEVANLGTGSHFGEMAFLDNEKRSASVDAVEDSIILQIAYKDLSLLLEKNATLRAQFYHSLSLFLCGRLRLTTNDLSYSREMNIRHF